ncbi:adenine-specific DNA methylase [mine drainage metagenome]|uniref:site-specific DNA-methyltransferase (cytosine-N(4)-specific) n=1 Tax=mine drainage metagenome TaxID=410659 RepID=T1DA22_9ZZZZ
MIPQIPRQLLTILQSDEGQILFDPYCGSGSTLVEGLLKGLNVIGTDINPLAKLISEVKTEYTIVPSDLKDEIERFVDFTLMPTGKPKVIEKNNLDFWFKPNIIKKIGLIIRYISRIKDHRIKKFFEVVASETIRESSNTRKDEFKLYRYQIEKLEKHNPDPFVIMKSKLFRNFKAYDSFYRAMSGMSIHPSSQVYSFSSVKPIPHNRVKLNSVDIVITSPPYGDSHTTVAYGQYSRLSSEWLGILKQNVDAISMGGASIKSSSVFGCESLDNAIKGVSANNPKRGLEVNSFYVDLEKSIKNVSRLIKDGGYACYVVANRKVTSVSLPTNQAIEHFFEKNGFSHFNTFIRAIPNKRMPSRNSPTNIAGKTEETMSREYIVSDEKGINMVRITFLDMGRIWRH